LENVGRLSRIAAVLFSALLAIHDMKLRTQFGTGLGFTCILETTLKNRLIYTLPHPRHEAALTIGTGLGFTCIFETTHKN
jgi:hypothetical protein